MNENQATTSQVSANMRQCQTAQQVTNHQQQSQCHPAAHTKLIKSSSLLLRQAHQKKYIISSNKFRRKHQKTYLKISWITSSILALLSLLILAARPIHANIDNTQNDDLEIADSIPFNTITSPFKLPDTTATVGQLFLLQIPPNAYAGNVSSIEVSKLLK